MEVFQAMLMSHFYKVFLQHTKVRIVRKYPCERKNNLVYRNYCATKIREADLSIKSVKKIMND